MIQEVYGDLYVLVNGGMDLLCLMLTAALTHRRLSRWRAVLGALFGGGYALAALLLGLQGVFGIALDVLAGFLMCSITFARREEPFGFLVRATAVNALASLFLGGIMTALYTWLNRLELPLDALEHDGLSVWLFAGLAALSGILAAKGGWLFGRSKRTRTVTVEAVLFGKSVVLCGMVDSGNLLKDPISGRHVIVAERKKLEKILPTDFPRAGGDLFSMDLAPKLRLIPAKTATGEGVLTAIVPDSLVIVDGDKRYASNDLIAPVDLDGYSEDFDALIPWE